MSYRWQIMSTTGDKYFNIRLTEGNKVADLINDYGTMTLFYDGAYWSEVSRTIHD